MLRDAHSYTTELIRHVWCCGLEGNTATECNGNMTLLINKPNANKFIKLLWCKNTKFSLKLNNGILIDV